MLHNTLVTYTNPSIALRGMTSASSVRMPPMAAMGFGTFQTGPDGMDGLKAAVLEALNTGYRHIDTAFAYGNGEVEKKVGEAIAEWISKGGKREDLFVVTKLHNTFHKPKDVQVGLTWSLDNLGLDYVDLFLMHNPYAYAKGPNFSTKRRSDGSGKPVIDFGMSREYPITWKAMSAMQKEGKTRMIGVSNFNILKLRRLVWETGISPVANQVEFNPYFPQYELLDYCKSQKIKVIAHCPLGGALAPSVAARGGCGPLTDPKICAIARNHERSPAQVILAWLLALGCAVVPKSNNPERIRANFEATKLKLNEGEMKVISELVGPNGADGIRNMVSAGHIGFDAYDEFKDQPVEAPKEKLA